MQDIKFIKNNIAEAESEILALLTAFYVLKNIEFENNRVEASFTLEDAPGSVKYVPRLIHERIGDAEAVIEAYTAKGYTVEFTQTEQNYVFAYLKAPLPVISAVADNDTSLGVTEDTIELKITGTGFIASSTVKVLDETTDKITMGVIASWTGTQIVVAVTVSQTAPYNAKVTVQNDVGTSDEFTVAVATGA